MPHIQDLLYKDEVYNIIGAVMEVHRELGPGFLEAVYQEALAIEFQSQGIPFEEQVRVNLHYKDHTMKTYYVPDFLCFNKIVVEIKAISKCTPVNEAQVINALKSTNHQVGILINFGESSLYWKRYVLQKGRHNKL